MATLETMIRHILESLPTMFDLLWNGTGWEAATDYGAGPITSTADTPQEAVYGLTVMLAMGQGPVTA